MVPRTCSSPSLSSFPLVDSSVDVLLGVHSVLIHDFPSVSRMSSRVAFLSSSESAEHRLSKMTLSAGWGEMRTCLNSSSRMRASSSGDSVRQGADTAS